MRREDVDAVLEIERRSFAQPWSGELFLQELRLPFSEVLLARVPTAGEVWGRHSDEGRLVGYICRWITNDEVHVLNVAVHPDWRGRNVGRRLVEHVLGEGRRAGAERVLLEVRRHNVPALALYESLGFTQMGVRRNYYGAGEDALVLQRVLRGKG